MQIWDSGIENKTHSSEEETTHKILFASFTVYYKYTTKGFNDYILKIEA